MGEVSYFFLRRFDFLSPASEADAGPRFPLASEADAKVVLVRPVPASETGAERDR